MPPVNPDGKSLVIVNPTTLNQSLQAANIFVFFFAKVKEVH
jgi:hypothetical protein